MITYDKYILNANNDGTPVYYAEGKCLSRDSKPTDLANGSALIEMDTGKLYLFDAANELWLEFTA